MLTSAVWVYAKGAKKEGGQNGERQILVAFVLAVLIVTALLAAGCGFGESTSTTAYRNVDSGSTDSVSTTASRESRSR